MPAWSDATGVGCLDCWCHPQHPGNGAGCLDCWCHPRIPALELGSMQVAAAAPVGDS